MRTPGALDAGHNPTPHTLKWVLHARKEPCSPEYAHWIV